jgi:hypothetical protein
LGAGLIILSLNLVLLGRCVHCYVVAPRPYSTQGEGVFSPPHTAPARGILIPHVRDATHTPISYLTIHRAKSNNYYYILQRNRYSPIIKDLGGIVKVVQRSHPSLHFPSPVSKRRPCQASIRFVNRPFVSQVFRLYELWGRLVIHPFFLLVLRSL